MTIQPRLTLEAELSTPMKATDIRAFLDTAEQSMDDVTVEARPLGGQMAKMSMKLTATGTAKGRRPHSYPAYRGTQGGPVMSAKGQISDGYHTFDELYEYRMLYNAHAAIGWDRAGIPVCKSWRHSDGEPCFGGGWFIATALLGPGQQVSNHYEAQDWDLFQVPEVDFAPVWDGHTPQDAANRLRKALTTMEDQS